MDGGSVVFFTFLAAIIIVPQVLRHQERGRLHDTLRMAFERGTARSAGADRGAALGDGGAAMSTMRFRRRWWRGWQPRTATPFVTPTAAQSGTAAEPIDPAAPAPAAPPVAPLFMGSPFISQPRHDFRRGVIWVGIGLGLLAAGVASYAGAVRHRRRTGDPVPLRRFRGHSAARRADLSRPGLVRPGEVTGPDGRGRSP